MRLRHLLLSTVCALALPAMASAADLPLRSAPPAFLPPPPVFTWTGFYLGVNAGYDFDHNSRFRQTGGTAANNGVATGTRPGLVNIGDDGFTAGGQIGYNYQFGGFGGGGFGAASLVLGLEADIAYTDLDKRVNTTSTVAGVNYLNSFHSSLDYLGTVRGRLGLAFDRVLIYGTGGFAYGDLQTGVNLYNPGSVTAIRFHGANDYIQTGYAVGGGIEYAVPTDSFLQSLNFFHSSAVTVKAEYLYYDLGSRRLGDYPVAGNGGTGYYVSRVQTDGNLARIGINYKF